MCYCLAQRMTRKITLRSPPSELKFTRMFTVGRSLISFCYVNARVLVALSHLSRDLCPCQFLWLKAFDLCYLVDPHNVYRPLCQCAQGSLPLSSHVQLCGFLESLSDILLKAITVRQEHNGSKSKDLSSRVAAFATKSEFLLTWAEVSVLAHQYWLPMRQN